MAGLACLCSRVFSVKELTTQFPPHFVQAHKSKIYSQLKKNLGKSAKELRFSRWTSKLPANLPIDGTTKIEHRNDVFQYTSEESQNGKLVIEWYLNFADAHLFGFFEGSLLAQDELQVLEHPGLGSLRRALEDEKDPQAQPLTRDSTGKSTPCLVFGVERLCALQLNIQGHSLYGRNFAQANWDTVKKAVRELNPPTVSNIIAIEAPKYGRGKYTSSQINDILSTAYSGFYAAVQESNKALSSDSKFSQVEVVIHSGYWGCGAFGGNKILMVMLQILAAKCAGVNRFVFHCFGDEKSFTEASSQLAQLEKDYPSLPKLLAHLESLHFQWGVSDGN